MEIGLSGPEDFEALARIIQTSQVIGHLRAELPSEAAALSPEGSDLAEMLEELPDPLVDIRLSIQASLRIAGDCLEQIVDFVEHLASPTTSSKPAKPIVLQTLARTALLASARVIFVLGSDDKGERERNAKIVLRQESKSLTRLYNEAESFQHLRALVPPQDVLDAQRARAELVNRSAPQFGEAKTLQEMAQLVGRLLVQNGEAMDDPAAMQGEHLSWMFNVYSGVAHGFAWPGLVPGTEDMPGHFLADLMMISGMTHLAFFLTLRRSQPSP